MHGSNKNVQVDVFDVFPEVVNSKNLPSVIFALQEHPHFCALSYTLIFFSLAVLLVLPDKLCLTPGLIALNLLHNPISTFSYSSSSAPPSLAF